MGEWGDGAAGGLFFSFSLTPTEFVGFSRPEVLRVMKTSYFTLRFNYFTMSFAVLLTWLTVTACDDPKKKDGPYVPPAVCQEAPELPKTVKIWIDDAHATAHAFDDSEFVLDREGRAVTVDRAGNVVRRAHDGSLTVLAEGVVKTARGLAYLSTGELVIADSGRGKLVLVYPNGESRILAQHLDFPHGLCVDRDDTIYVAENSRAAVSRVHPRTGAVVTVVTGLPLAPSGISFSPDYLSLYIVGSTNEIYAITRDEAGVWGEAVRFAVVPGGAASPCEGKTEWESCTDGGVSGTCQFDFEGNLVCVPDALLPCEGKQAGDSCVEWGTPGICTDDGFGELWCAPLPPCEGKQAGDACVYEGSLGACTDDGSGELICRIPLPCEGKQAGDPCADRGGYGLCTDDGGGGLWCRIPTGCEGKAVGDGCLSGDRPGRCLDDGSGSMYCAPISPCEGKQAGDACMEWGNPGVCVDDGLSELWCRYVDPCEGQVADAPCIGMYGAEGTCLDLGSGYLNCEPRPACEGKLAGDPCVEYGTPGTCMGYGEADPEEMIPPGMWCEPLPVCPDGADGAACTGRQELTGACLDSTQGYPYCQSDLLCDGLTAGAPCTDPSLSRVGVCAAGPAGLFCALENPCATAGQECLLRSGRGSGDYAFSDSAERMIAPPPESELGVCQESGYGLLYCAPRGPCWELAEGDACRTDWGTSGTCVDYGDGQLYCEERTSCAGLSVGDSCLTPGGQTGTCVDDGRGNLMCVEFGPCDGLVAGDACTAATGVTGTCLDDGQGGLFCRPSPACAGKAVGDPCTSPADGLPGTCAAGAGDLLVCQPAPPCQGKNHGDACTAAGGHPGTCVYQGQGEDALFCDALRSGGQLRAVSADACGNVYVAEAGTRVLWRFTPEGVAQWVASELRAPVTGLFWGSGAGGWDKDTLYLGHEGGARVSEIDLGIPGRPIVTPKRSDTRPAAGLPTNLDDACLLLPAAPLEVNQLEAPRGYHDVTFDDRGWMVGYNGNALMAVSSEGASQAVALGFDTVQGLAALPDGSIVASTVSQGVQRIYPNGAQEVLAPDLQDAYGVTVGPDGLVYVSDHSRVYRIDPVTKSVTVYLDPTEFGQSWQPRNVAFDPDHSLMVISSFGDSVYVVALDGNLDRVGVPRKLGRVVPDGMWLDALAVDSCGNIYIPNFGTASLYRISPDGRSRLYHKWEPNDAGYNTYGHGGDWGVARGGWRTDALYMPQPYNDHKVIEMVVGVPGVDR